MARYYLHIRHKDEMIEDKEGFDLPSLTEAQIEALRGLSCILADALLAGREPTADAIAVTDEGGVELMVIPLAEVLPDSLKRRIA